MHRIERVGPCCESNGQVGAKHAVEVMGDRVLVLNEGLVSNCQCAAYSKCEGIALYVLRGQDVVHVPGSIMSMETKQEREPTSSMEQQARPTFRGGPSPEAQSTRLLHTGWVVGRFPPACPHIHATFDE